MPRSQTVARRSPAATSVGQWAPDWTREREARVRIVATGARIQARLRQVGRRTMAITASMPKTAAPAVMWPLGKAKPSPSCVTRSRSSVGRGRATSASRIALGSQMPALSATTMDSTGRLQSQSPATSSSQMMTPPGAPVSHSPIASAESQPGRFTSWRALAIDRSAAAGRGPGRDCQRGQQDQRRRASHAAYPDHRRVGRDHRRAAAESCGRCGLGRGWSLGECESGHRGLPACVFDSDGDTQVGYVLSQMKLRTWEGRGRAIP